MVTHSSRSLCRPLIALALSLSIATATAFAQTDPAKDAVESRLRVTLDPRIELLAVVQLLSGYEWSGLITRHDVEYKKIVTERFAAQREHPAVTMFAQLSKRGFSFDGPVATVLHFGDPPALKPQATVDDALAARAGSREELDRFMDALRDFAHVSDFAAFFAEQKPLYDAIAAEVARQPAELDPAMLEEYFGRQQHSYTVILAPLFHPGGFGPRIARDDGSFDLYAVCGPMGATDGRPAFGQIDAFRYLVWHEFSHSFVNPVVDAHGADVDKCAALFEPLRERMAKQAYKNWRTCVYEHVVRAVTCRFAQRELVDEAGRNALADEQSRGFIYVAALTAKLAEYEQRRQEFADFNAFFPELLKVFADAAAANPALIAAPGGAPPKVEWSVPDAGAADVDPGLTEIMVQFDREMQPGGYSWTQQGADTFPQTTGKPYWKTPRICVLPVKLEPGKRYWLGLNSGRFRSFRSATGVEADEYILEFTTRHD